MDDDLSGSAWLFRYGKPPWRFDPVRGNLGELVHVTNRGTRYAIMFGNASIKPIWIGVFRDGKWLTCEKQIRANRIYFSSGGVYAFPQ